jgi:hypothetical protein
VGCDAAGQQFPMFERIVNEDRLFTENYNARRRREEEVKKAS